MSDHLQLCPGEVVCIGDGYCDPVNNNAECEYDGGDCCACTCVHGLDFSCGSNGHDCQDPEAPHPINDCVESPVLSIPCPSTVPTYLVVNDSASASALADAVYCAGGTFNVEWWGNVVVEQTIHVTNGTTLRVTGANSEAAIDGRGIIRLFTVMEASLQVSNMTMYHGKGMFGGCVTATKSDLRFSEASFIGGSAEKYGGAVYVADSSTILWEGRAVFMDNQAGSDGGAIYVESNTSAIFEAVTSFVDNTAKFNGGGLCIRYRARAVWGAEASFVSNMASIDGGALFIEWNSTVAWRADVYFVNNTALDDGGALSVDIYSEALWEAEASFVNNTAGTSGGAVCVWSSSTAFWGAEALFILNTADGFGGALSVWHSSIAIWKAKAFFISNAATGDGIGDGGALWVWTNSKASWEAEASFMNNTARDRGGAVYVVNQAEVIFEGRVMFDYNSASGDGGAVYLFNGYDRSTSSTLRIEGRAAFSRNWCKGNGGAVALTAVSSLSLSSDSVTFVENHAGAAGGAISITGVRAGAHFIGASFRSNVAQIGGAVYVTGSGIALAEAENGTPVPDPTIFERCQFIGNMGKAIGGAVDSGAGLDVFSNCRFERNSARAGGALRLAGTASLINCAFIENTSSNEEGPAVSNVGFIPNFNNGSFFGNVFKCQSGYFLDFISDSPQEVFDTVCQGCHTTCQDCSTSQNVPQCSKQIQHTSSPGGNTTLETLVIDPRYWRATEDSRNILACYNADACLGGVTGTPDYCSRGYEGPYCAICSKGFFASTDHARTKCSGSNVNAAVVAIVATAILVVVVVSVASHLKMLGTTQSARGATLTSWKRRLLSLKIVIIAWQILTQFASVANVTYPDIYQQFLDGIDMVNLDLGWILQTRCLVDVNFHHRLIVSTVGPLVGLAIIGVTYVVARRGRLSSDNSRERTSSDGVDEKYLSVVLLLTFVVYSSVSSTVFQTFVCDHLDDGNVYLRTDYRIKCDSSTHRVFQAYASCMILLYTAGIPMLYATLLFRHRDVLTDVSIRGEDTISRCTSSLWSLYKPRRFYYELVECLRRVMLAGVAVFIYPNTANQIAIVLMLSAFFMVLSEMLAPYASVWDAWASRFGHAIVFSSIYLALLLKVNVSSESLASQRMFEEILIGAHVIMVMIVLLEAVVLYYNWFRRRR